MTCQVCQRGHLPTHVRASPFGPMSLSYCEECLPQMAEPEWTFEYLYSMVADKGEGLNEDMLRTSKTWKDGKYWTWDEWKTWRRLPEQAHLDTEAEAELEEYRNHQEMNCDKME